MNYFKLLLYTLLVLPFAIFAMEKPTYEAGQSPLEQLPISVQAIILEKLAENKTRIPYCQRDHGYIDYCVDCKNHADYQAQKKAELREQAIANVRNFTMASKTLSKLRTDREACGKAIQALAKNHFNHLQASPLAAAMRFPTAGSFKWLQEKSGQRVKGHALLGFCTALMNADTQKVSFFLQAFPELLYTADRTRGGENALHTLLKTEATGLPINSQNEILDLLLKLDKQRILVTKADDNGNTALMFCNHAPFVAKLISHGANVTAKNNQGETFINYKIKHLAKSYPTLDAIIQTIPEDQRQRLLDEPDNAGNAPVINAIITERCFYSDGSRYRFPLESLLKHGANPNARNALGQAALEIAYNPGWHYDFHTFSREFVNILWKYNPENKWTIYRKNQLWNDIKKDIERHPVLMTFNVIAGSALTILLAKEAYNWLSSKSASINTDNTSGQ